ncbi:DUF2388 domain-containing protein [Entomomonas asaccharolytica]|uniref:DUF2388 domain-containing protein n=1 Tax=Entomomonas asaccharolytica TaxID=2785331 RepID=A0A974NDM7_9GAMM|nr:DUF2388 domain-containing protein [Entomomonas asaccharolytica]QQP84748.1 DUF2388 domain-containing protein [Entomomonas asaccharolytica]
MKTIGRLIICLVFGFPLYSDAGMCTRKDGLELLLCQTAFFSVALPSVATIATSVYTEYEISEKITPQDKKIILKAANDAVFFIATESKQQGVYLQAAFNLLRERLDSFKELDDYQLAMIIISFNNDNNAFLVYL